MKLKKIQLYKGIKKIQLKIEDQNKFYIWLKDEIKKKNQFTKMN
jgi:hypothetical protein